MPEEEITKAVKEITVLKYAIYLGGEIDERPNLAICLPVNYVTEQTILTSDVGYLPIIFQDDTGKQSAERVCKLLNRWRQGNA